MQVDLKFGAEGSWRALVNSYITLYFDQVGDVYKDYVSGYDRIIAELKPHIRWYQTGSMKHPKKATGETFEIFPSLFNKTGYKETYWLNLYSGIDEGTVGEWAFYFSITPLDIEWQTGYMHIVLPTSFICQDIKSFKSLIRDLCDTIPFCSGHAGLGIHYDFLVGDDERDAQIRSWASRYFGLEVPDLEAEARMMKKHIKGVNWITILGNNFIDALGGCENLRKLGEDIIIKKCTHGVLIQAGDHPILGDVNRREDLSLYKKVNVMIHSIRTSRLLPLPGFSKGQTQEWIERFDEL